MNRSSFVTGPGARNSATRSAFDSLVVRDEFALVSVNRFVLFVWRTALVREGASAFIDAIRRRHSELGETIGAASYFDPAVTVAHPPEVRRELVQGFAELRGAIGACALIREGGGFPAAALRSSVTSMQLEHGNSEVETAYFTETTPAVHWLTHTLNAPAMAQTLDRMFGLLRDGRFDGLGAGWARQDEG